MTTRADQILLGQPWLISPEGLEAIQAHLETTEALSKQRGQQPSGTQLTSVRGDTAIIEILGPLFTYSNALTEILNFPSTEKVMQEIQSALDDPQISSVVLQIDSPGGQLGGTNELAGFIQKQNQKPIRAYVGGLAASAAYWIASAADEIVMEETAQAGSIGVVLSARRKLDNSTEIVSSASPKKRPDPATDEGKKQLQQRVDDLAQVFIQNVASNRGISQGQVTALEGDVVIASKAIEAGLADQLGTLESVIAELQGKTTEQTTMTGQGNHTAANPAASASSGEGQELTQHQKDVLQKVLADKPSPQGFEQAVQDYQTQHDCSKGQAIKAVAEQCPELHQAWLQAWQDSSPRAQRQGEVETHPFWQAAKRRSQEQGITLGEAIKAISTEQPELHRKFQEGIEHG